ncbi:hypothetical protein GCM10010211_79050 [Streptomyces albospinus]|uniref:Uncharacterized protein n=1 Tax=Streptomyces albospinus TaxID=285515 RepID=A0ABQ2VMS3_9ACTN|nr:hypothetical protein GCM10010211_79050 [Streptomyces albospinus]
MEGRPWPTITIYHRYDGEQLLAASLFRHTKWDVTEVKVPRSVDGLETVLEALRAGEGFRVDVPDPPYTPGKLVLTRNRDRGLLVEGSRSPGAARRCIDMVLDAATRRPPNRRKPRPLGNAKQNADSSRRLRGPPPGRSMTGTGR